MTVWYDTTAVFGDGDVVLRTVVVTVCVRVVLRGAAVCRWCRTNRMTHGGHHCSLPCHTRDCWVSQVLCLSEGMLEKLDLEDEDGCTTQDYMHTDRYHDCPQHHVTVTKDCSGVVTDCHRVTQNGSGSSSVTSPALVLVETPNESVCGGTVVSTEINGLLSHKL
ncbi:hypothetical protein NFI96_004778 [Prochilodus magdalenae]|nr:hypothetical protein NFI96_004778 [Prochilodus magdalenae]